MSAIQRALQEIEGAEKVKNLTPTFPGMNTTIRSAEISPCGLYRYTLRRVWNPGSQTVLWVCLNPSIANGTIDDPTVRVIKSYSSLWGFGAFTIVNLFALRETDPKAMKRHPAPVGPLNDQRIREEASRARLTIAAWGVDGSHMGRAEQVQKLLGTVHCLVKTKGGHPGHPTRKSLRLKPIPYA